MAGGLKPQLVGHPTEATWRSEATKLISPDALLMVVMELARAPDTMALSKASIARLGSRLAARATLDQFYVLTRTTTSEDKVITPPHSPPHLAEGPRPRAPTRRGDQTGGVRT
eukprot:gene50114-68079_t